MGIRDGVSERLLHAVRAWQGASLVLLALAAVLLFAFVDLEPEVGKEFFFASDDPQLREDREIQRTFPEQPQVLISAAADDVGTAGYLEKLARLSAELQQVEGVLNVRDILHGPDEVEDAFEHPLWRRLLVAEDGSATYLLLQLEDEGIDRTVPRVEEVLEGHDGPDLRLAISGVPYVVVEIRRQLARDLKVFGLGAMVVFGVVAAVYYRSVWIVAGILVACGLASLLTLILRPLFGMKVDVLTPNIATIVFVLTLSHIVFLTANWRVAAREEGGEGAALARTAVRWTRAASFWAMVTTGLGFLTLVLAPAAPLRNFGLSCALGAALAMVSAYLVYPAFLISADPAEGGKGRVDRRITAFLEGRHDRAVAVLLLLAVLAAPGLLRLDTDPDLLSYFAPGTELREDLERMDREGGSSPLEIVIQDAGGRRLSEDEVFERMWALQERLERDAAVGAVISLPVLLAGAEEEAPFPFNWFLGWDDYLDELGEAKHGRVARSFVTEDRQRGRFVLRMKEGAREAPREDVVERLEEEVRAHGFTPLLTGGLYRLQGQLSDLVRTSVLTGLAGLAGIFALLAFVVSRSLPVSGAMVASFAAVPILLLGGLGYLRVPLDVISTPAATVAMAIGIDDMVHLVFHARRRQGDGDYGWEAWVDARRDLWRAAVGSSVIIALGFALLLFSSFLPTRRLGLSVVAGTLIALILALLAFPRIATWLSREG